MNSQLTKNANCQKRVQRFATVSFPTDETDTTDKLIDWISDKLLPFCQSADTIKETLFERRVAHHEGALGKDARTEAMSTIM